MLFIEILWLHSPLHHRPFDGFSVNEDVIRRLHKLLEFNIFEPPPPEKNLKYAPVRYKYKGTGISLCISMYRDVCFIGQKNRSFFFK